MSNSAPTPPVKRDFIEVSSKTLGVTFVTATVALGLAAAATIKLTQLTHAVDHLMKVVDINLDLVSE